MSTYVHYIPYHLKATLQNMIVTCIPSCIVFTAVYVLYLLLQSSLESEREQCDGKILGFVSLCKEILQRFVQEHFPTTVSRNPANEVNAQIEIHFVCGLLVPCIYLEHDVMNMDLCMYVLFFDQYTLWLRET